MIKTRFAPSPTGLIHLGNARTALFSYLYARHGNGVFLLRIEDTDVERSKEIFDEALQQDLQWLGLQWQEGPGADQGNGPYHQSKRQSIYVDYYHRLEVAEDAYPCFCSEDQLALARKMQRASGKPPRYPGTCRSLSSADVEKRIAEGQKPTLRFRVPDNAIVSFEDTVRGEQRSNTNDIGDFIIRRANGTSPFLFCSVIDDALMGVTDVLRGEDHLTNTPRQILILQALGLSVPRYGHISLIVGSDGSPLSKRHGSRSIQELREQGYLSEAVVNYMARLGHYYESDDLFALEALAQHFRTTALSKSPAKFNPSQLDYWQKISVERLSEDAFWKWAGEALQKKVPEKHRRLFIEVVKPNIRFPQDANYWADVCFHEIQWNEEQIQHLRTAGSAYFDEALIAFEQFDNDLKAITNYLKEKLGVKGPALYQPLRLALTGAEHGPELAKLILLMGHEKIKSRLGACLNV